MGNVAKQHSAAASLAGFLFQLDLALLWLAQSSPGSSVGVETLDDITMVTTDSTTTAGQAKLSYCRNPFGDFNPNLWKTFYIWLSLVENEEIELDKAEFHLISNFDIQTGIVAKLKAGDGGGGAVSIAAELKSLAKSASNSCQPYASHVLTVTDASLSSLVSRVRVHDGIPSCPTDQLPLFAAKLNLPESIASMVVRGMRGWVQEQVEAKFAAKEPAWLEREAFCHEFSRLNAIHFERKLVLRAEAEIDVSPEAQKATQSATFVRQLRWIDADADEVLDAINDYLRSGEERTRLATDNNVTKRVFDNFKNNLFNRWKNLHRHNADEHSDNPKLAGRKTLRVTMDHREPLDGQGTSEYYLTRGTYHEMANGKRALVGWHPKFREILENAKGDNANG